MSFLRSASSPVVTPQFTGVQIQTSSSALPIPIVYGRTMIAPNILWTADFQSIPQYGSSGGKGGGAKGGFLSPSSGSQVTSYDYRTAIILGLCEGPIVNVGQVYNGQTNYSAASDSTLGILLGPTPQTPWSYVTTNHPNQALGYGGTALIVSSYFDLGSSASISGFSCEVKGVLYGTGTANANDADPAQVVYDFLTSAQYGVGFPAASIDATSLYGAGGDASYQTYCKAHRLAFSPALTNQETANSIISRWLQITNSTAVWSGGRLKFMPYGDGVAAATQNDGSTITYQPSSTVAYDLTDDDFIAESGSDPIIVTRSDPYSASNVVQLEALDRVNQYGPSTVEARDQGSIEQTGLRQASTVTAHEYCTLSIAGTAAQLILQRGLYIRNTYAFKLSWEYCLLEPMDVVTLTDAGLGLAKTPVRITEISEDSDGLLSVTAEEYPGQVGSAAVATVDSATSTPIDRGVVPAPVNPPVILEPPSDLTNGVPQMWVGLSGGTGGVADPNWGGAAIFASTDNASYMQVGTTTGAAHQGILAAAIGASDTSIAVSFSESAATLISSTQPTLFVVDGEIMAFATATLTGSNAYALGGVKRRLYGQRGGAHAAGAQLLVLDKGVFTYNLPLAVIYKPLWLKFASVNVFGGAMQDLSTCTAYQIATYGSGYFGPVAQAIATGTSLDEGFASTVVNESDDFGLASDPYVDAIDEGLASEAATALAVQSGGTGATSGPVARQNIGAAAAGSNSDITALNSLTKINGSTAQAITIDPATSHVGIGGYTADANNALGVTGTACLFTAATDSMRFTFNKVSASFDAALSFQTGFSVRALAGLLGSDGYQLKVSPNGSTFYQVYVVDQTNGNAAFKALLAVASFAVTALPAGFNGAMAFATNGRKIGEAAGAGSGVIVAFSNGQWRRLSDETAVAA